ncbi:FAD-dependent oxidoreductase [Nostocoides sp. F2B08]|uniref:FAD-dependent oxidoreductase n=1 Tax=Nostocoides sp. F2B08 TaxID=2653936 RepID=UPI001262D88C|nr:FAD-dependent oxidoreductase [Tetrasphaera sp. F2B08]KAB7743933.1 FAD-dependent oxidoreductase [Tetrasphaera sp. F2B08]
MSRPAPYRPGRDARAVFHPPPAPTGAVRLTTREDTPHVVVVGGGIAGLAAATALSERGADVTLIEREESLGGRVRAWPITLPDGSSAQMSRGFHAFFRQYYTLRALLRRVDPELSALTPLEDYPLVRDGGGSDSFAGIPRTPPWNLVEFVRRSPSFTVEGLRGVDIPAALGLLDVDFPQTFSDYDGVSAAQLLDDLRFPEDARHLALEVFARSFFADPREFSAAELLGMFHTYFVGSAEGLLFDVPDDDYDATLWGPLGEHLERNGVTIRRGTEVTAVRGTDGGVRVETATGEPLETDAVVLALDPPALRRIVARLDGVADDTAGLAWRDQVAAIRSAPPFVVWRIWTEEPVHADRPPFLGTSGYGPVDNVSAVHLFEGHAREYARRTGGAVVEVHAYAVPTAADPATHAELKETLRRELARIWPETDGMTVVHEEWLVHDDCVLVGLEPWADRAGVTTPDPRLVLAGDAVRADLPVALMERAAVTGVQAADHLLASFGRTGHGVWSVPTSSRLGPWPGRMRRLLERVTR